MVMIGSLFAGHDESPGKTVEVDGQFFKEFYGSASDFNKGEYKHVEGKRILEPIKGSWPIRYAKCKKMCRVRFLMRVAPGCSTFAR